MNACPDQHPLATHQIRLASQWSLLPLPADGPPADRVRLKQLADYPAAAAAGGHRRFQLVRWFGRPTNLNPTDRIELVSDARPNSVTISLNEAPLQPLPNNASTPPRDGCDRLRWNVTGLLNDRNCLTITFLEPASPEGSAQISDLRLEITAAQDNDTDGRI